MSIEIGGQTIHLTFKNVRTVPGFQYTLASVPQFEDEQVEVCFGGTRHLKYPDGTTIPFMRARDRMYVINATAIETGGQAIAAHAAAPSSRTRNYLRKLTAADAYG